MKFHSLRKVMNDHSIKGIGDSMTHWANYISNVRREDILNEGSIKYGISEYLVSSTGLLSNRDNRTSPKIEKINFEYTHPIFSSKRLDLYFQESFTSNGKSEIQDIYIEFKFMRKNGFTQSDCKLYIYDLLRLASIRRNELDSTRVFFMLVGYSVQIKKGLNCENSKNNENKRNNTIPKETDKIKKKIGKYLNTETETTFAVNELEEDFNILGSFYKKHKYKNNVKELNNDDQINLKKVYPTEEGSKNKIGVYIWEISVN